MGPRGAEGIFLGLHRSSNSYIIGTDNGQCIRARAITRRAERERWNPQALADVRKLPEDPRGRKDAPRRPFDGPPESHGPTSEIVRPAQLWKMRINKSDLVR